MPKLFYSKRFEKNLARFLNKYPELESVVKEKLQTLSSNPKNSSLKTHKLTGKLKNFYSIYVTYEYRLVFYLNKNNIYLVAMGTHDEVY